MEFLRYWKIVQKQWWLIILLMVVTVGSTGFFTWSQPPVYESSTTLLLNPAVPNQLIVYYQGSAASTLADSYTALMHSSAFAESVQKELPFNLSNEQIIAAITTQLVPNTLFYKISARMESAENSQQFVNTVVKVFLSANADQQQPEGSSKSEAVQKLEATAQKLTDQIEKYESAIADLEAAPVTTERDAQLLPLYDRIATLQQAQTEALVALTTVNSNNTPVSSAAVLDAAQPGRTISSNLLVNLLVAAMASLALGVGLAFFLEYLDYTVHSPEQLEELLSLPPMAAIGMVGPSTRRTYGYGKAEKSSGNNGVGQVAADSEAESHWKGHNLVTLEYPKSPESESFRALRTNIQFATLDKSIHSLLVTSSGPREGKSFTAANLAVVMAQAGRRVILVDADLRRPTVHTLFGLPNQAGFTTLMLNNGPGFENIAQPVPGIPGLTVLTSGPLPPNPSELLNSQQGIKTMERLSTLADVIIYDAPPTGAVTDPLILAVRVDAVVLVVSAGFTRRDVVQRVKRSLENVGVKAILPVLNKVQSRDIQGYYYYYHRGYSSTPQQGAGNETSVHSTNNLPVILIEPGTNGKRGKQELASTVMDQPSSKVNDN